MPLEWLIVVLMLAVSLWPLASKSRSWRTRILLFFILSATVFGGLSWRSQAHHRRQAQVRQQEKLPRDGRPGGYVKSDSCRACHVEQYDSWYRTYHRTMTQEAGPTSVRGDFANVTLSQRGEAYHLTRRGHEYWVNMVDPDWKYVRALQQRAFEQGRGPAVPPEPNPPRVDKRITLTTGSHHMQAYWVAGNYGNQQFSLPFTYLLRDERWVARNDVFMLPADSPVLQQVWNSNCLGCHATAGQPGQDPQTKVIDSSLAEYGIACEACHGPAAEHIRVNSDPLRRYQLRRNKDRPDPSIANPVRLSSKKSAEICGQCHAARYSPEPTGWLKHGTEYWHRPSIDAHRPLLPGNELRELTDLSQPMQAAKSNALSSYFWADGMIRVSGREYNGLYESPCFQRGEMSCLSCHSMHHMQNPASQMARGREGNGACYQCHQEYASKLTQHTHHEAGSSGSLCYNCHMPHTTYGLMKAIRSHQITSPTAQASLSTGRPNACNLCHLDRSLNWTAGQLKEWYGQPAPSMADPDLADKPASAVWLLKGDAGQRALIAWHMGWEPARMASGTNWMVPYLAETLDDPYSVVRYIGEKALRQQPGLEAMEYDYVGPPEARTTAKSALLQRQVRSRLSETDQAKILPVSDFSRLLQRRNHRPMELLE